MQLLRRSITHCDFPSIADDLFPVRTCCLANVLPAPRFPSFRPDTASFRSCLLLPPGFLARGRLAFEQEAVRVSFSSSPRLVLYVMTGDH